MNSVVYGLQVTRLFAASLPDCAAKKDSAGTSAVWPRLRLPGCVVGPYSGDHCSARPLVHVAGCGQLPGCLVAFILLVLPRLDASCHGLGVKADSCHLVCSTSEQVLLLSVYHTVISIQNLTTNEHVLALQSAIRPCAAKSLCPRNFWGICCRSRTTIGMDRTRSTLARPELGILSGAHRFDSAWDSRG